MSSFTAIETLVGILQAIPIVSLLASLTERLIVPILIPIAIPLPLVIVTIFIGLDILARSWPGIRGTNIFCLTLFLFIDRSILLC